jgi:hypothetical protein
MTLSQWLFLASSLPFYRYRAKSINALQGLGFDGRPGAGFKDELSLLPLATPGKLTENHDS